MDLPIGLRNGVDAKQTIFAALREDVGQPTAQAMAIDAAIDHDMGDMETKRCKFARHALGDHA